MTAPNFATAAYHADDLVREATYARGRRDAGLPSPTYEQAVTESLTKLAATLGYKLVPADAPADVVMGR